MGKLLKKNWKKILIVLGAVVLVILLYYKVAWKPSVVNDYVRSEINIERDVIDSVKDTASNVSNEVKEGAENLENKANETDENGQKGSRSIVGWGIILGAIIVGILILDAIMQPSSDKKKK
ncbi:MAG: hypothetical protein IJ217_05755 [Clostridia bacterium]|nr:hypothetical protein [Clostridia bacterium]